MRPSEICIPGTSPSISISAPATKAAMPPIPKAPKLGRKASVTISPMPSSNNKTPTALTGSMARAYAASSRQIEPMIPETPKPGV